MVVSEGERSERETELHPVLILVLMDGGIGEDDVEIRLKETLKS